MTEDELFFVETSRFIRKWDVRLGSPTGTRIARVVERVVADPLYLVRVDEREDATFDEREDVVEYLLRLPDPRVYVVDVRPVTASAPALTFEALIASEPGASVEWVPREHADGGFFLGMHVHVLEHGKPWSVG